MMDRRFELRVLNEAIRRVMLNETPDYEALRKLADRAVERGISDEVGDRGPLKLETGNVDIHDGKCHLVRLSDIMGMYNGYTNVAKPEFKAEMRRMHANYAKAMASHHPESVRSASTMEHNILNRRYSFTDGDSYILMFDKGARGGNPGSGYWIVTHFAPSSDMAGYKLMKELFHYDNIIMAITDHMWPMMAKMGLVYKEFTAMIPFNGQLSEKMFFTTDKELMKTELMDTICETMNSDSPDWLKAGVTGQLLSTQGLYGQVHSGVFPMAQSKQDMGDIGEQVPEMVKESLHRNIFKLFR